MRLATLDDLPTIGRELAKLEKYAKDYGFISSTDLIKATSAIAQQIREGNGYVLGDYLVMVAEVTPWYSNDKLLQEWFTMKLRFRANGRQYIPDVLQVIAEERGCSHVLTADSSNGSMTNQWQAAGFSPLTQSFYTKV